ncbi:hypothetical protein DFJ74DRAFT_756468 [Hyaloraphidium curvatum]|nr:hypothetical protein DFJ74DRAFT_756468 [Hyaloraphidium curvatum]
MISVAALLLGLLPWSASALPLAGSSVVFKRSCSECSAELYCDFGIPGTQADRVACVDFSVGSEGEQMRMLYRRYAPPPPPPSTQFLAVQLIGDGTTRGNNEAVPVSVEFYDVNNGLLNKTIAIPTAVNGANYMLTQSYGNDLLEGLLSTFEDGEHLALVGFNAAPGTASVPATTELRVVGLIDRNGAVDTTTTTTAFSGDPVNTRNGFMRRAVGSADGSIWVSGFAANSGPGGVRYLSGKGASGLGTEIISGGLGDLAIFEGNLFTVTLQANPGLFQVGTGLPTSSASLSSVIGPVFSNSFPSFSMVKRGTSTFAYICHLSNGLRKWAIGSNTPNWTLAGGCGAVTTVLDSVADTVTIYLVTSSGAVVRAVEGSNGAVPSSTTTLVAAPGSNYKRRGIALFSLND